MKELANICPLCDEGELKPIEYGDSFKQGTDEIFVSGLKASECSSCEGRPILPEQIRYNQVLVADAKREKLGYLKSYEIKEIREKLAITQQQASMMFGGGANAFSKYERGDSIQSEPMDKLLRVAVNCPEVVGILKGEFSALHPEEPIYKQPKQTNVFRREAPYRPVVKNVSFHSTSISIRDWTECCGQAA